MERSPEYLKALEQVRRMPQETKRQKAEKREQAKVLRMQVLLDNARCAELLTDFCEHNPFASPEEFTNHLRRDNVLAAHPEAIDVFIHELRATAARVTDALRKLGRDYPDRAKELFRLAAGEQHRGYHMQGIMEVDTTYPLALILYVANSEDFQKIDTRANIGGFYRSDVHPSTQAQSHDRNIPLIVVRGQKHQQDYVKQHEVGHSKNNLFVTGMAVANRKFVWTRQCHWTLDQVKAAEDWFEKNPGPPHDGFLESPLFRGIIARALSYAKDEILADHHAADYFNYTSHLLERGGTYDYFAKFFNMTPGSALYEMAWKDYEMRLTQANTLVSQIADAYRHEPYYLHERVKLFRWALAQIPLDQWERQLTAAKFDVEADALRHFELLMPRRSSLGQLPENGIWARLIRTLQMHQHESLIPYLRDFVKTLDSHGTTGAA